MSISNGKTVLVVEDEQVVAMDLQISLTQLGYRVDATAASAAEALELASIQRPDLVLMDIRIRGDRDGIEVAEELRAKYDVPIVYLTAYADEATVARAKLTEPYGYLVKPVRSEALRSTLELALHKYLADRKVRRRETWFATTLRSIGDGVLVVDAHGEVVFMNPAAEMLLGAAELVLGRSEDKVLRWLDQRTREPIEAPTRRAVAERRVVNLGPNALVVSPAGEKWIEDSAAPIIDAAGDVLGAVMVFRGVSEARAREREQAGLERLGAIGTLAAGVSHECHQPLSVIVANSNYAAARLALLSQSWKPEAPGGGVPDFGARAAGIAEALAEIPLQVERIRGVVKDLRYFAKPDERSSERVELPQVMEWALRVTQNELSARATVTRDLRPVPLVFAEHRRLGQVFVNLLLNAAHAIDESTAAAKEIRVATGVESDGTVFATVSDTGPGIAPEVLPRLFEPFFTTRAASGGTGLGLAICHGIIKHLGGEITVESTPGAGTVFRVALPPAPPMVAAASTRLSVPARRRRVLVIDDEATLVSAISGMLEADHEVVAFTRPADALAALQRGDRADAIICDLKMPGMSGMQLYTSLIAVKPELADRFIFMTGGLVSEESRAFVRRIASPVVEKPFDTEGLRAALAAILAERDRGGNEA